MLNVRLAGVHRSTRSTTRPPFTALVIAESPNALKAGSPSAGGGRLGRPTARGDGRPTEPRVGRPRVNRTGSPGGAGQRAPEVQASAAPRTTAAPAAHGAPGMPGAPRDVMPALANTGRVCPRPPTMWPAQGRRLEVLTDEAEAGPAGDRMRVAQSGASGLHPLGGVISPDVSGPLPPSPRPRKDQLRNEGPNVVVPRQTVVGPPRRRRGG